LLRSCEWHTRCTTWRRAGPFRPSGAPGGRDPEPVRARSPMGPAARASGEGGERCGLRRDVALLDGRRARGNDAGVAMNGARVAAGRALAVAIVGLLLVIAAPLAARAQPTGGSAGGPWGGGAGGGALRPGGQGPEVRPGRATSETLLDTSPRGAARAVAGVALLVLLLITAAGFVDAVATGGRLRRALFWRLRRGSVVAISIALDAGARDEAQERLADLAGELDL